MTWRVFYCGMGVEVVVFKCMVVYKKFDEKTRKRNQQKRLLIQANLSLSIKNFLVDQQMKVIIIDTVNVIHDFLNM